MKMYETIWLFSHNLVVLSSIFLFFLVLGFESFHTLQSVLSFNNLNGLSSLGLQDVWIILWFAKNLCSLSFPANDTDAMNQNPANNNGLPRLTITSTHFRSGWTHLNQHLFNILTKISQLLNNEATINITATPSPCHSCHLHLVPSLLWWPAGLYEMLGSSSPLLLYLRRGNPG